MLARGVPIDGVGLQMHTGPADASPSAADIASNMQRLAALGLDVMISEMDVQICTGDLDAQSRRFHDIVAGCVAQPFCRAVTVWGVTGQVLLAKRANLRRTSAFAVRRQLRSKARPRRCRRCVSGDIGNDVR